ncbi:uncharacterized protein N7459_007559 [Penicillium hispanicum]|uniref:uncharacterized protein n=1 Tax=Penicillium hispanicum TaxID=1080232 RepID=UPI0025403F84|nr:uncharacterized protein N7459_007559 [Penicillium hispanicum]KAJ5578595.1 hypothetical protein N7459_007559 [Penicillium hispanicum]
MDTNGLIHRIAWTPVSLSEKPLTFGKVLFLIDNEENPDILSTYQSQLAGQGYITAVAHDTTEIEPSLTPDTIVVHVPHTANTKNEVYEVTTKSCTTLIAAAQALYQRFQSDKSKSCQLFSLINKDSGLGDLSHAPLLGLARTLKMEVPNIFGGLFEDDRGRFPLLAIQSAQGFDVVKVCQGVVQTASLQSFETEPSDAKPVMFSPDGTYLITGGTRGIGLEIAGWMGQRGAGTIILVSRRGLPPDSQSEAKDTDMKNLISRIDDLEALGVKVHVLGIDVSKPGADSTLKSAIEKLDVPPVKGAVHAAGIAGYHNLERCVPSEVADVLATKVIGGLNLDALFSPGSLDFFYLVSSVGQLVGFEGQLSYAPSNSFLEGLAAHRRLQGDNSMSILWTCWRGVGLMAQSKSATRMITKGMQERGLETMSIEEAFAAWDRFASLDTNHVAIVRAMELDADEPLRHPVLRDITPRKQKTHSSTKSKFSNYPESAVAIVGLACRTAAGDTADDFWDALQAGKSMVREIDLKRFPDAASKGKMWGNFLSDVDSFDHQFFKKSKREAAALDPHQRVLLETTYQAVESAGWLGIDQPQEAETHDRRKSQNITGCFIGMNAPDYPLNLASNPPSPYTGAGMLRSFVSGRLSYHFGWTGPSHVVDTACSSAMVAIHQACRAIQTGECTRAVAGGINLITNTALFHAMRVGGFLSETGPCKTFDARADGYCRGEAAGVIVLKPLRKALSDGDDIQGVLLSTGNNQNINNTSITNPVLESQAALYQDVLARAGVSPRDISYVEAHGTGTRAGDPVEVNGIRRILGGKERESILHIGGVKANVGHSEGASGVISLIKVLLMMKHGKITPQAQFEKLNPNISALEPDRMAISRSVKDWNDESRLAVVNSYGASGNNAAAVVAPPPSCSSLSASHLTPVPVWPVFISAASKASLAGFCNKLQAQLDKWLIPSEHASSLAFSLATKQSRQFQHVFSTTASSMSDLQTQLSDPEKHINTSPAPKPIALLFSGQNGNAVPSARAFYDSSVLFRTHIHRCDEEMQRLGLPSLIPAVLQGIQGDGDLVVRHAAMFAIQYSSGMSWIDSGVKPQAICGHSFGEWAALTVSGAMNLHAGMKLVTGLYSFTVSRAAIIEKLWGEDTGSMVAIEAELVETGTTPTENLQPFYEQNPGVKLDIACYNGPNNYVVAGRTVDIELLESYLKDKKASGEKMRFKVLKGMYAYHSVMADSIVDESAKLSASIPFQEPLFPFESCHEGTWTGPGSNVIARNTRGAVYFTQAISRIVDRLGACTFLEAGIGGPIIAMARNALPQPQTQNQHTFIGINSKDPLRSLADATVTLWKGGQLNIQYWPFHRSQRASYLPVTLPPYQFEKHKHWLDYVDVASYKNNKSHSQPPARSGLCPHCLKDVSDYAYIAQDKTQAQGLGRFVFKVDTRSRRYQEIVKGHIVVGSPIAPAAMYLELVAHAVALLEDTQTQAVTPQISAERLEIKAPMGLDTQRSLQVILTKETENAWNFELSSTKTNSKPVSHASGTISLRSGGSLSSDQDEKEKWVRLSSLLEKETDTEALRGTMVYKVFSKMARYSPGYRGLHYLVGKGLESAGDITIPLDGLDPLSKTPNDDIADPFVVDTFLQVPGAFVHSLRGTSDEEEDGEMAYICTGMGSVRPLNGLKGSGDYRAYAKIAREDSKETVLDVLAFDKQSKKIVWFAKALKFSRVPRSSLAKVLAGATPSTELKEQPTLSSKPATPPFTVKGPAAPISTSQRKASRSGESSFDVLSGVQEVLSQSLDIPVQNITKQAMLEELGTDSLVSSEILANISRKFKVDISSNEFSAVTDVASLCGLISGRVGGNSVDAVIDTNYSELQTDIFGAIDVLSSVQEVLSQSLDVPVEDITEQATLEELGTDSLVSSEILANISTKFQTDISTEEFSNVADVSALCDLISCRVGGKVVKLNNHDEDRGPDSGFESADEDSSAWQKTVFEILSQSLDVPVSDIDMHSKLEDLGADSLVAAEIISNLNDTFSLDISPNDFASITDVISLCNVIATGMCLESLQTPMASSSAASRALPVTPYTGATTPAESEKPILNKSNSSSIHTAFQQIRHNFDAHAKDTRLTGYWNQVYPQQLSAVTAFIVEAFEKLGCPIGKFDQGEKLPTLQGTLSKYWREVPRLWDILDEAGVVEKAEENFLRGPAPLPNGTAKDLSSQLISTFPPFASTHGLPDLLGPHLAECLTGKADPVSLLFGSERGRSLLEDFYANGPDLRAATQVLCDFFSAAIHAQASQGEPFRVLEIGAGTGGTTKHLVPLLQATGLPFTYTFTELSVSLLARAKRTFKGITGMEFQKLNIEEEPPAELLGRYHVVVSSNCVHATRDLSRSLTNIYKLCRPEDGCVALVELTQKLAWYDLVWGLLDGWWLFDDGRKYALQSPWSWEQAMRDSGFAHVDWSDSPSRESRGVRVICGMTTEPAKPIKASSMTMHRGSQADGNRNLFLVPDGFGSGSVFGALQPLLAGAKGVSVYALNSPFLKSIPTADQIPSIEELAAIYVAEIKRRQPDGPYLIGGYSVGGVLAYEAARQLLEDGNEVEKLFLIDSACPTFASSLPDTLVELLDSIDRVGMVNEDEIRAKTQGRPITSAHFTMSRQQVLRYKPTKLPGRKIPQAVLVSAKEGVGKKNNLARPNVLPEEQEIVSWFLDDRTDGDALGWDELLGDVNVVRADGNHFSLMMPPMVNGWGLELAKHLGA